MWHGTKTKNHSFASGRIKTPLWLTSHKPEAEGFAGVGLGLDPEDEGDVVPITANLRNPMVFNPEDTIPPDHIERANALGHDGIIAHRAEDMRDPSDPMPAHTWAIVFDPNAAQVGHQTTSNWTEIKPTTGELLKVATNERTMLLPEHERRVGSSVVEWWESEPGVAVIMAKEGTADDRAFAEQYTKIELEAFGFKRASFTFEDDDPLRKTSAWTDIMAKAKRLIQSNQVQVLRNGWNSIIGHVIGDHGEYQTEIGRDDPNSRAISTWQCECPWDQYAWQRTRDYKKYEGRPCSHVLALYWASLGTPLDDHDPNEHGPLPPGQKQAPPAPPAGGAPPPLEEGATQMGPVDQPAPTPTGAEGQDPGLQAPMAPPGAPGVLPPAPMDQMQQAMAPPPVPGTTPYGLPAPPGSVSVPGARMVTPYGPVQYPGGTYSKIAAGETYINGEVIRTTEDVYGMKEGREGATDAGQYTLVPAGSTGEVLGQDPSTGWVEVIFPLDGGQMTSYHARCFLETNQVQKTRIRPPGPMVRRRH